MTSAADGGADASDDDGKGILQQGRDADHEDRREQTATEPNNDNNERYSVTLRQMNTAPQAKLGQNRRPRPSNCLCRRFKTTSTVISSTSQPNIDHNRKTNKNACGSKQELSSINKQRHDLKQKREARIVRVTSKCVGECGGANFKSAGASANVYAQEQTANHQAISSAETEEQKQAHASMNMDSNAKDSSAETRERGARTRVQAITDAS